MIEENLTPAPQEEQPAAEVSQEETKTTEEAPEGETAEEENTEPEPTEPEPTIADITAKQMLKGYTQTRQEISEIRKSLNELKGKKDEYVDEDKPLTKKELVEWEVEKERQHQAKEQENINLVNEQVDELRLRGIIKSKADEEAVLNYAIAQRKAGRNKDLITAGYDWQELQNAKLEGGKAISKAKKQVIQEEGSKVGTSQKTAETEQEFDYREIRNKSFDELSEG